jgi:GNAT superfamily N-acetyltransferase
LERAVDDPSFAAAERIAGPGTSLGRTRSWALAAEPCEVGPVGVEYLVRAARVTDIDRIVALSDDAVQMARGESPLGVADLMRQLVYLPQASVVVAEAQRVVAGGAVLALRPSVRAGGYVGTIDLLVVDPEYDADRITEALLEELLRSASNKGCTVVEAERPVDEATFVRWQRMGFGEAGPRISKTVAAAGSAARRTT